MKGRRRQLESELWAIAFAVLGQLVECGFSVASFVRACVRPGRNRGPSGSKLRLHFGQA